MTKTLLIRLDEAGIDGDDEEYHILFDTLLEQRLAKVDPAWMTMMRKRYKDSDMARWYS